MSAVPQPTRMAGIQALLGRLSYSDFALAFGAVAIMFIMILPLPTWLIDILLALSITSGLCLLMMAIYVPSTVAFAAFPSVILLTTLFRLALSIATTRLILLNADAGHIVYTFGNLVAGGNLVVGIVIFIIITVVQFIVVAKGSERVAEVAARFTLDAMPGKQMSIDSDLRSGLLEPDEAKAKRRTLEQESQLHGALDGAMKYVKGDAIAGMVIILINLLGGMGVGVLQRDMDVSDALQVYSILTIGDGLVAQFPSLLSSMAAGIFVTRATGNESEKHLGDAISGQFSREPKVWLVAGVMCLMMACIPGFPWPVFLALALVFLGYFFWVKREDFAWVGNTANRFGLDSTKTHQTIKVKSKQLLPKQYPLILEYGKNIGAVYDLSRIKESIKNEIRNLELLSGIPLPEIEITVSETLNPDAYQLSIHSLRVMSSNIDNLSGLSTKHDNLPTKPDQIITDEDRFSSDKKHALSDKEEVFKNSIVRAINRQLPRFLGLQETMNLVQFIGREYPDLTKETLRVAAPSRITEILKRLVDESISIRPLRDVMEAIIDSSPKEKDIVLQVELIRVQLRRQINQQYIDASNKLNVLLIHPTIEDTLRDGIRATAGGANQLALDRNTVAAILNKIREAYNKVQNNNRLVVLCSADIRRYLRKITETDLYDLPIFSYQEINSDITVVPTATITM